MKSAGLGGCIVSENILQKRGKLRWCVKAEPVNELDNGWRFFSDIDTEDFLKDAKNMIICDWNTVVEIEPAILAIFDLPVGTELTLMEEGRRRYFIYTDNGKELIL